jgi:prepilin-type processing-associated H-X9-DG protein
MAGDQSPRRGVPLIWVVLLVVAGLALVLMAAPLFLRRQDSGPRPPYCLSNVKNLSLAVQMYVSDYDDVFPPAAAWCDTLLEYVRNEDVYRCPEAEELPCAYAFNAALGMAKDNDLARAAETIVIFESDRGWNAAGGRALLPAEPRHLSGDNYGFADGHASWVGREEVMEGEPGMRWRP